MKKPENQNILTAAELYTIAEAATSTAVRSKHSQSGNKKLSAIQNGTKPDQTIDTARAEATTEAQTAAKLTEAAHNMRQYAKLARGEEAAAAKATAAALTEEADEHRRAAARLLDSITDQTFTDRRPIVHDAIVGYLTAIPVPYVITPKDMEQAAESIAKAIQKHPNRTAYPAHNAARSAAAIIEAKADTDPGFLFDAAWNSHLYRAATNAASAGISANLHHDSHTAEHERKTFATPEIMAAWKAVHGDNSGTGYKVYTGREDRNFYTMEYREYKHEPTGFYLVYHHKTISPTVSIEAFTDESHGNEAEIVTNGGIPTIETQTARERIEELIQAANLTKRERDFLTYFLKPRAAHAGQAAVNAAITIKQAAQTARAAAKVAQARARAEKAIADRTQKPEDIQTARDAAETARKAGEAAKAAERAEAAQADSIKKDREAAAKAGKSIPNDLELIRYRAMVRAAAAHVGIETDTARRKFMQRLRERAHEAARIEQGCTTPEEAAQAEERFWKGMHRNRTTAGIKAAQLPTYDLIAGAIEAAKAAPEAAPVITWKNSGTAPEATNPGEDIRTAEVLSRDEYRQTAPKAEPPELTPREARERARLAKADEDTRRKIAAFMATEAALIAMATNAARVTTIDTQTARPEAAREAMPEADTRSPEAVTDAERIKATAANLPRVKVGKPVGKVRN